MYQPREQVFIIYAVTDMPISAMRVLEACTLTVV